MIWTRRNALVTTLAALGVVVIVALAAVLVRLAYDALAGSAPSGNALGAIWAFLAACVAAAAAFAGALFTRAQAERTEKRLALDTAIDSLRLLTTEDGTEYAPKGVVAGAIATLVHLKHPVIAMRVLAACWDEARVDTQSATWLISEIFQSDARQAQLEAAAMLDAHADSLCRDAPGSFSWPPSIEFDWIPNSPFPARLYVFRAILRTQVSKDLAWWHDGGREGWAVVLLNDAMQTDTNESIRTHAKAALGALIPLLQRRKVTGMRTEKGWLPLSEVETNMDQAPDAQRRNVMLRASLDELKRWASNA